MDRGVDFIDYFGFDEGLWFVPEFFGILSVRKRQKGTESYRYLGSTSPRIGAQIFGNLSVHRLKKRTRSYQ